MTSTSFDQERYPRERIPKNAVLTVAHFRGRRRPLQKSVLDVGCTKFVTSGSQAIGLCLAERDIGVNHKVLLPAYHCMSMVTPIIWRNARPVFYKIKSDTSIDLADVVSKLDSTTRVLLVPHYFGFSQNAPALREFCDRHGLIYIEDCAHAFFGTYADQPLGSFGDYAIASPWKFFPAIDGGLIVSARSSLKNIQLQSPGAFLHVKAALNALEYSFDYGRLTALKILSSLPLKATSYLWQKAKGPRSFGSSSRSVLDGDACPSFDSAKALKGMPLPSRITIVLADMDRIAATRRRNYLRLEDELRGLSGCRPLFPSLPAETVPQVFPLIVDDPTRIFPRLKNAGIPIIRFGEFLWPGVDATVCPTSVILSRKVFQFPCHQDLRSEELDWMVETIRGVMMGHSVSPAVTPVHAQSHAQPH